MWSDQATAEDYLGFSSYVDSLKSIVLEKTILPVTVGVFGDWGSGKTSLMKMLEKGIKAPEGDDSKIVTVWFNPWQYEGKDEVQSALIQTILDTLQKRLTLGEEAKAAMGKLVKGASLLKLAKCITKSVLTLSPDTEGFFDSFDSKCTSTIRSFNDDYSVFLEAQGVDQVVVFVDDLDRCDGERTLEIFETIQHFLDSDRCAFVIGADPEKIRLALSTRYAVVEDSDIHQYFEKVIQIPFRIPSQYGRDIELYVSSLILLPHIKDDKRDKYRESLITLRQEAKTFSDGTKEMVTKGDCVESAKYSEIMAELDIFLNNIITICDGLKGNPRQIKRFLNIFKLRKAIAVSNRLDIEDNVLVKLLVIEYTWEKVFREFAYTFIPDEGKSELLEELYSTISGKTKPPDISKRVEEILRIPGIHSFLDREPKLQGLNIAPYLFLSQTSLAKTGSAEVSSLEEDVDKIVEGINSGDKIQGRVALSKAKRLDVQTVKLVIEKCVPLVFSKDSGIATQSINSINELLSVVPDYVPILIPIIISQVDAIENKFVGATLYHLLEKHKNVVEKKDAKMYADVESAIEKLKPVPKKKSK